MSTHDSPGLTSFELGELIHPKQRVRPSDRATAWEWMLYEWPDWCQRMKKVLPADKGAFYVPPLLRWWKDETRQVEYFDIGLPGAFDAQQPRVEIPKFLRSSKGAETHVTLMAPREAVEPMLRERGFGDMPVLRVVLSYFRLPELEIFDRSKCPKSSDQVYLGRLSEGSPLVWDTSVENPHAMFVGKTRSGKSEAAASVATQFYLKGWRIVVITPTRNDPTFKKFADLPGCDVVMGTTDEDYSRALKIFRSLKAEMADREDERGEVNVNTWGEDVEGYVWSGRKTLVIIDESGDFLMPVGSSDTEAAFDAKKEIAGIHEGIARKGAKVRHHLLDMTQNPYVAQLGGGLALNQMGFVLAVRSLPVTFHETVFPGTDSPWIRDVLTDPSTKRGRGVARGAVPPENEFGGVVDDTPVQLAYLDLEARSAWLDEPGDRQRSSPDSQPTPPAEGEGSWVEPPPPADRGPVLSLVPDTLAAEAAELNPADAPLQEGEIDWDVIPTGPPTGSGPSPGHVVQAPVEAPDSWTSAGRVRDPFSRPEMLILKASAVMFSVWLAAAIFVPSNGGFIAVVSSAGLVVTGLAYFLYRPGRPQPPPFPERELSPGLIIGPAAAVVLFVFAAIAAAIV